LREREIRRASISRSRDQLMLVPVEKAFRQILQPPCAAGAHGLSYLSTAARWGRLLRLTAIGIAEPASTLK